MHGSESLDARGQMLRQLARQQHQQRQQEQQQASRRAHAGRELPAKQDQARRDPAVEAGQREGFSSDQ